MKPMPQKDITDWLHHAMLGLPSVTAAPQPGGGVEYQIGEVGLGHLQHPGRVDLDPGPQLADLVVRSGWAAPNGADEPGRLTIDLAQPQGGLVALWLLCRNYRWASTSAGPR
jgi:hypothetical protein